MTAFRLPKRSALASLMVSWTIFASAIPALGVDCPGTEANANVVEISLDGVSRHASGVLITFDGYVITAAHPLVEGLKPPYPIGVFARQGSSGWQRASVNRVDSTLDLALLKLEKRPEKFFQLLTADVRDYGSKTEPICLSGFGMYDDATGKRFENSFLSIQAQTQGLQLGYYFANTPVQLGYSGGAAFIDGELAGLILRRSDHGTFIIPVTYVADFLIAQGIFRRADRSFEIGTQWSQVPQLVDNNRRNIEASRQEIQKILRSINWLIELQPQGADYAIVFTPKPVFPDQKVEGAFLGKLQPHFEHDEFNKFIQTHDPESLEIEGVLSNKGVIEITDVKQKIRIIQAKYRATHHVDLSNARLTKVNINGSILFDEYKGPPIIKELRMP